MTVRRERAPAMTPDERREALVAATLPLLLEHGRGVSTRQIAEAADVAEGTIYRAFETKDALVEAAIGQAYDPAPFLARVAAIDPDLPLRERLVALTGLLADRFGETFDLMRATGTLPPPQSSSRHEETTRMLAAVVVGADGDQLRVPPEELLHLLRLLAFSGRHPHIAGDRLLTPEQIVDVVLVGTLATKEA